MADSESFCLVSVVLNDQRSIACFVWGPDPAEKAPRQAWTLRQPLRSGQTKDAAVVAWSLSKDEKVVDELNKFRQLSLLTFQTLAIITDDGLLHVVDVTIDGAQFRFHYAQRDRTLS